MCNYFPRKTGLFFDEAGDILAVLLHAGRVQAGPVRLGHGRRVRLGAGRKGRDHRPDPACRRLIADGPALLRTGLGGYAVAATTHLPVQVDAGRCRRAGCQCRGALGGY